MHRLIIIFIGFFITFTSHAFEIKPVKDNETVDLTISSKSLNRLFVTTDRIVETYGMDGSYKMEKDEEQGNLFIMPTSLQNTPFDLFIKTEHGHQYTLHLTPADIESATIALKPLSVAKEQALRWERSSSYENVLIDLIKYMAMDQTPEGYAVIPLGDNQPIEMQSSLSFKRIAIYRGDRLEGKVWSVKNMSDHTITLHPKNFHDERILAASFDKKIVRADEEALLYSVISHES